MNTNENDDIVNENNEENNGPQQSIFDEMREKLYQRRASVPQESNEQTPFSSNPFIARTQREEAEDESVVLDEFDNIFDRQVVQFHANMRIIDEKITDDAEKQRVYDEVKEQYKEYLAYREQARQKEERPSQLEQTEKRPSVRELAYRNLDKASPEVGGRMRSYHAELLWEKTLKRLQEEVSPAIFQTWFKDTAGISYQDDVLIVTVSTPFAQTQLEGRFIEQIRAILSEIDKAVLDIRFESLGTLESNKEDSDDFKSTLLEIKRDLEALESNNADNDTSAPSIENNDPPSPVIEDITQHPEFIKGYQRCVEYEKEQEEQSKSPYKQGWSAAFKEIMENKTSASIAAKSAEEQQGQSDTSLLDDLMENNAIKGLQEEVRKLDERLRKLEIYTEE